MKPNKYKPRPTEVRNARVAQQMSDMHDAWFAKNYTRVVAKGEPDPESITSIKLLHRVHRGVARAMKQSRTIA